MVSACIVDSEDLPSRKDEARARAVTTDGCMTFPKALETKSWAVVPPLIPENLDALLSRKDGARALTAFGYVTSPQTLATKATRGKGPPYRNFGKRAIYRWGDLIAWAEANTTPLQYSTSETTSRREAVR